MPNKGNNYIGKYELLKRADYGFPQIMNKTEASFYLWRHLDIGRLNYLITTLKIRIGIEDGREVITKKELDRYMDSLYDYHEKYDRATV